MPDTDELRGLAGSVGAPVAAPQRRVSLLARRGLNGFSEDFTKPLLLGYLRRDLLVVDGQVTALERQMSDFAQTEGFAMGHVYVEKPESWPAAFEALIESVNRYEVTAVVLPSLLHFASLSSMSRIRDTFQRATGARVLVLTP
jgi:hypothetical protein